MCVLVFLEVSYHAINVYMTLKKHEIQILQEEFASARHFQYLKLLSHGWIVWFTEDYIIWFKGLLLQLLFDGILYCILPICLFRDTFSVFADFTCLLMQIMKEWFVWIYTSVMLYCVVCNVTFPTAKAKQYVLYCLARPGR